MVAKTEGRQNRFGGRTEALWKGYGADPDLSRGRGAVSEALGAD